MKGKLQLSLPPLMSPSACRNGAIPSVSVWGIPWVRACALQLVLVTVQLNKIRGLRLPLQGSWWFFNVCVQPELIPVQFQAHHVGWGKEAQYWDVRSVWTVPSWPQLSRWISRWKGEWSSKEKPNHSQSWYWQSVTSEVSALTRVNTLSGPGLSLTPSLNYLCSLFNPPAPWIYQELFLIGFDWYFQRVEGDRSGLICWLFCWFLGLTCLRKSSAQASSFCFLTKHFSWYRGVSFAIFLLGRRNP